MTFHADHWDEVPGFDFTDITYHRARSEGRENGVVRIAFDRPEVRNAFRPNTVDELYRALDHARMSTDVGCILLTGNGPAPKDGVWSFCSGGDQRIRGKDGYKYAEGTDAASIEPGRAGRLHILEVPLQWPPALGAAPAAVVLARGEYPPQPQLAEGFAAHPQSCARFCCCDPDPLAGWRCGGVHQPPASWARKRLRVSISQERLSLLT